MALVWSWAFGPEVRADLEDMGWAFSTSTWTFTTSTAADKVYSYSGSPPRYSMVTTFTNNVVYVSLPAPCLDNITSEMWVCLTIKCDGSPTWGGTGPKKLLNPKPAASTGPEVRVVGQTLAIYDGNSLRATTPAYDWSDFHYVAFYSKVSAPKEARIYVDGVLATSYTSSFSDSPFTEVRLNNPGTVANPMVLAQLLTWDPTTTFVTGPQPYFVTRLEPNEDVAGSGTWSPPANPGAPAQAPNLASPYNTGTTVVDATPATGDKIIVATDGSAGTDLNTKLNTTVTVPASGAPSVAGVTCHTWSIGDGVTNAKAGIENATGTVYGTPLTVDAIASTYITSSSDTQPGGAAWVGTTPSPDLVYEVD
jgi:hypothetical protein